MVTTTVETDVITSATPIPDAFTQWRDTFPPQEALEECAEAFNDDLWNELTDVRYNYTEQQLDVVTWVEADDPRIPQAIAVLGITGPGQTIQVTNRMLEQLAPIVHSTVNPALIQLNHKPDFRERHMHCSLHEQAETARNIINACGCTYRRKWND